MIQVLRLFRQPAAPIPQLFGTIPMNRINEPGQFRARITDWPVEERPREKLMRLGADKVSSAELVAILLGKGTPELNAVELARKLLRHFKTLEALSRASFKELQAISGIGPAKAVTLLAAFQLYRNLQKEQAENEVVRFTNPEQVAKIYQPVLGHEKQEVFYVLFLDAAMQRIADMPITKGIMDSSLVHPREVFHAAIRHMAKGIIVLHNHPSGNLQPSAQDQEITDRLVKSGKILDIPVYDHLIITADGYFSFKEAGLMD
ncbi:MAG TPA: JAB domain-containing protein [Caldithrix abyssi]|uniref:JAB domain-containing protein n=1 Tax=Caldithrix abyssi TaxID=187145 RepID=A0A7V5PQI8_CALAY|nr:JAB domain-containing protein [Caldithrix abyssi]